MKSFLSAAVALGLCATPALAQDGCDSGETVIKFSHVVSAQGHPKGEMAEALAQRINEEMNGKACMQVFPNSQLYDDDKVMEALLLGDVQLAAPSLSKFGAYTRKLGLFDLPFLFPDIASVDRFVKSEEGQSLLTSMSDYGYVGMGYINNGLKQFSADKPLIDPSDAKGLKFRVQTSDVAQAMIEALGANAQKLAFNEVYGALQTGVVDGQENTYTNIYTQKFFEVQDGITETNHQVLTYFAVTTQEFLDSLDDETREQFVTLFNEVADEYNARSNDLNEEAKQKIVDAGGEIRTLTPEQRQKWVDVMKPVWAQFSDEIGQDLIDAAVAAGNSNS
ncbi:DctP family TRAP transporter solute-binding subunit [Acuticoccus sp. I52.16.1]|uniref:DctP family TRAP transporter solute-binding subunit n=1 Tax=Acuticoccus sp. I52.16.1 TaxID=2928472 RepID=UPI001FD4D1D0|nr:DctP family TRAP transporter solute-binding subunit [Acuticoccus sp. I52.16.1]UOM33153.1 DctP family TRAP transporter solute-binding subunit [Acuticoccus sp. I52.16.1]